MSPSSRAQKPSPSAFVTLDRVAARTPDSLTLFDNLSLAFGPERTGLVGRNGVGKTTLLRLVAGLADPVAGTVTRTGTVAELPQSPTICPGETVAMALGVAGDLARIARITAGEGTVDDLAEVDWTLEARLAAALSEVGLEGLEVTRERATLSGGEQTRLSLAALRLNPPDLLLLDEPTNHLDREGRVAVARLVERWPGGVVVVSHDRGLLRRMDRIVELSSLGVTLYGGDYDRYAERKAVERAAADHDLAVAVREAARVARDSQRALEKKARRDKAGRAFAARRSEPKILLGAMAERAENSGARDTVLSARRLEAAEGALSAARERVERVRLLDIPLPASGLPVGRTALVLDRVRWDTPEGRPIVGPVSLRLTGPERLAITGTNGSGKTTLLKLICGERTPTSGRIERSVSTVTLDQDTALLRPDETLISAWSRLNPGGTMNDAHAALARFRFRNAEARRVVATLSGGERLRAALACVLTRVQPPQLLVLDEPTNHLDLDSLAAVEASLAAYDGALVVVSHDPDFLAAIGIQRSLDLDQPHPATSPSRRAALAEAAIVGVSEGRPNSQP